MQGRSVVQLKNGLKTKEIIRMIKSRLWKHVILMLAVVVSTGLMIVSTGCTSETSDEQIDFLAIEDMEKPVGGLLSGTAEIKEIPGQDRNVLKIVPGSWFSTKIMVPESGAEVAVEWTGIIRPDTRVNVAVRNQGRLLSWDITPTDAPGWQRSTFDLTAFRGNTVEFTLAMPDAKWPSEILVRRLETYRMSEAFGGIPGVIYWLMLAAIGVSAVVVVTSGLNLAVLKRVSSRVGAGAVGIQDVVSSGRIDKLLQKAESIQEQVDGQAKRDGDLNDRLRSLLDSHDHNIGLHGQVIDHLRLMMDKLEEMMEQTNIQGSSNGAGAKSR